MMKVLDLNAVISDTETLMRRTLGSHIRMTAIFASSLDPIRADARKLQQVILRLAAHARQSMPTGGRFTIETNNLRLENGIAPNIPPGAYVALTLSNTNAGMNDAALQRIFDPVVEIESHANGMGLEMSKVPTIIQQFDGHIHVECQPDGGAAFKIYLPSHDKYRTVTDVDRAPLAIPHGTETILLVDDEDSVRTLIRILLKSCGYNVLEAVSSEDAIRVADHYKGPIDLLITDVVLPRINGKALVNHLVSMQPAMKVLLISGYSNDRLAEFACDSTNFAFLQKPFKCDILGDLVRRLLDTPEWHARSA